MHPGSAGILVHRRSWSNSTLKWLAGIGMVFGVLALVGIVVVVLYEIAGRLFLEGAGTWTNSVAETLLVWLSFLGVSTAIARNESPRIEALVVRLPDGPKDIARGISEGVRVFLYGYILWVGVLLVSFFWGQELTASSLPYATVTIAVPAGGALMLGTQLAGSGIAGRRQLASAIATVIVLGWAFSAYAPDLTGYAYWILFPALALFLLIGTPVAESLLASAALTYQLGSGGSLSNISLLAHAYGGLEQFTFVAIPLFLLTGAILSATPLAALLIDAIRTLIRRVPGSLGITTIAASAVFADISGSAAADTVAIGTVMIPEMKRAGYEANVAAAIQAGAGSLGLMFPPSITMLLYAAASNTSVAVMFASLIVPGLIASVSLALLVAFRARRAGEHDLNHGATSQRKVFTLLGAIPAGLVIVLILGGMFGGFFTASEAGAVASLYVLIVGGTFSAILAKPKATDLQAECNGSAKRLPRLHRSRIGCVMATLAGALAVGCRMSANVTFIIACALTLGYAVTLFNAPADVVRILSGLTWNKYALLLVLMAVMVIIHSFMDVNSTILVLVPLLLGVLTTAGVSLVQFGVLVQMNSSLGLILPPIGINLYLAATIAEAKTESVILSALPFAAVYAADLILLLAFPQISTFVPRLLGLG
jgi:TRAP-type C4-dicarboxylate transport system permease large subunit/TRAP-type C4-dicarboxylate transport system permease small subunit